MYLNHLSILNYKNLAEVELDFEKGLNCLIGDNGVGKTNLLDAIYYLACCKSRLTPVDLQNIKHDEPFMMVQGNFDRAGVLEEIGIGLKRGQRKSFKRNGKEYDRLSDHIGLVPLVIVSPEDSSLITDGSETRRKFMDGVISQYDREYLYKLIRYNKLLLQRNTLLKSQDTEDSLYDVCELQMEELAVYLYQQRLSFIKEFVPIFNRYYSLVSQEKEKVGINYRSHLQDGELKPQLEFSRRRDSILGYTSKGIHKDELELTLGDYPIKMVGSQGQGKSFVISLRLAQFDFLKKANGGETPLLLLDDIFDKLDAGRVTQIIKIVSGDGFDQIFITDTNREHLDKLLSDTVRNYRIYRVESGKIQYASI